MIVFACKCGYTFVIDLEASKAIGPIRADKSFKDLNTGSNENEPILFIGNNRKEISLGAFRDFYSDCWRNLLDSIPKGK